MQEAVTVTTTPEQDQYPERLEDANASLRRAVLERKARHAVAPPTAAEAACDVTREDCCQGSRMPTSTKTDQAGPPAEQLLQQAIDVIRDRRPKYGGPRDHFRRTVGMINAAFADILRQPLTTSDWAVIMVLDKVARHRGPTPTPDTPIDLAGYAACLHECES